MHVRVQQHSITYSTMIVVFIACAQRKFKSLEKP